MDSVHKSITEDGEQQSPTSGDIEAIFFLMLMGELPSNDDVQALTNNWARRAIVPRHVFNVLDALPRTTHPMSQFTIAIMAMQTESVFAAAYRKGINKKEYWSWTTKCLIVGLY